VVIFGRRRTGKDLANEVDDGIASSSKFSNDFEFDSRVFVVCVGRLFRRLDRDEAKDFTQKRNSLTDEVAGGQNIVNLRGFWGASLGGGRAGGKGNQLGEGSGDVCVHVELSGHGEVWVKIL
jgi:hypothetical protein